MKRTSIGVLLLMISFVMISFSSCKSSQSATSDTQVSTEDSSNDPVEEENVIEQTYVVPKETYTRVNTDFKELAELSETFFYDKINDKIEEIYGYFESKDTPVLTVVTFSGDRPVFDRPMTIEQYLNYLKDKKTFNLKIYEITVNKDEKITKLVLSK